MSVDGITLRAICQELQETILEGKITRIFQPMKQVITIEIRRNKKNHKLLIAADAAHPRLHLTRESFKNPKKAPDFCMLLRKHIKYSIITGIEQDGMDRILEIHLQGPDDRPLLLVVEIMGRHSNIILLHKEIILGSIKRVTTKVSRYRQVLPGLPYLRPPSQKKEDPLEISPREVTHLLHNEKKKAFRILLESLQGLGPLLARDLFHSSGLDPEKRGEELEEEDLKKLCETIACFQKNVKEGHFSPSILVDEGETIKGFSALSLTPLPPLEKKDFSSLQDLFDYLYVETIKKERMKNLKNTLWTKVQDFYKKGKKRLKALREDLEKGEKAYSYKKRGDLITANIYQIKRGLSEITLPLLEDPQKKMTISLNPAQGPAENAQKYYQRYQKLKKSCHHLEKEIQKVKNELKYLSQVLASIEQAQEEEDLLSIWEELEDEKYIKERKGRKSPRKVSKPLHFLSSQKYDIFVGRNNRENDYLTMKMAQREDMWLHVKDLAGSHVIIKNHTRDSIPEETIEEAAILAACYSRGHLSSKVPVDYTLVKYVQKPREARPGMVYYKEYQTIYVEPDRRISEKLKKEV